MRKSPLHFCLSPTYQAPTDAAAGRAACYSVGVCSHRTTHPVLHIAHANHRSQLPFGRSWSFSASGEAPGPSCSTSLPLWCCSTTRWRSVLRKVIAASGRLPRGGSSQSRRRGRCHCSLRTNATSRCRCDRNSIRIRLFLCISYHCVSCDSYVGKVIYVHRSAGYSTNALCRNPPPPLVTCCPVNSNTRATQLCLERCSV